MRRRVVVTGAGSVSPFGVGVEAFREGLLAGRSTCGPIRSFDAEGLPTDFACEVPPSYDAAEFVAHPKILKTMSRATQFGIGAARMAWQESGLDGLDPHEAGVAVGVGGIGCWDLEDNAEMIAVALDQIRDAPAQGSVEPKTWVRLALARLNPISLLRCLPNMAAAHIAISLGVRGESCTVATTCTSATQAIGEAFRLVRGGAATAMIAGGCDAGVNPTAIGGFSALGVLSRRSEDPARACRPFDRDRDGFVMGEGAGFLVLEEREHALGRGAKILAEVAGFAGTNDGYRLTDEDPEGRSSAVAMRRGLADAGIGPEGGDYINAHGTGTRMNDATEARVLREIFGTRTPVSSTKSMIGHGLAAAGAHEALACLVAIDAQMLPPTINLENPDPACDLCHVPAEARGHPVRVVLKNSSGFGGQNACLVFRRHEG